MSRVYLGTLGAGVLQDPNGTVQAGQSVTIKDWSGANATHYSARTGGSSSTSAFASSATGTLERWVDPGEYTVTVGASTYDFHAVSGSVETATTALDGRVTAEEAASASLGGRATALEARHPSGTGSPEGVVTAVKGAMYQQTDGAQSSTGNSVTWIKETGTGNTGWRKLRTVVQHRIDLFAARAGGGLTLPVGQATYAFLTAVTASTHLFPAYLTGRVIEAILNVEWTPNDADNGIEFLSFDSVTGGVPDNPSTIVAFTGLTNATPITNAGGATFVTTEIAALIDGTAARYVGFRFKSDVAVAPVLFRVTFWYAVEV